MIIFINFKLFESRIEVKHLESLNFLKTFCLTISKQFQTKLNKIFENY